MVGVDFLSGNDLSPQKFADHRKFPTAFCCSEIISEMASEENRE